jgi:BirA family biotin operon repressor/biotin-[acetyl-CoA-carboxylase] ligase
MKSQILKHLPDHPWAELVQVHEVLDSTNTYAKELARQGAPEGTVVIARRQTSGRGRLGRSFHSPKDSGLYFSLILCPNCTADRLMHLTCAAAVAACDAVERTCTVRPGVKWINDLVLENKKLGGILTELGFGNDGKISYAVIGIGINCCAEQFPEEISGIACSLSQFAQQTDPARLAAELIIALENMSHQLLTGQNVIMQRYRQSCVTIGKQVRVISPSGTQIGVAEAVNKDGSLQILFDNGQRKNVNSGEVSVRGLWDYL